MKDKTSVTYGDSITLSNASIHATDNDPVGALGLTGAKLWGHKIVFGENEIECAACEMKEEVPEILQMSAGYRQALWKLYMLGKFKNESCERYKLSHDSQKGNHTPPSGTIVTDPNRINYTTSNRKI